MNLNVIYEDNHIIVVEKIPNIPSQSDKTGDTDMLSLIKEYIKQKYNKPGEVYLGLVHRLDRPVGGVMVFARTSKAASRLSEQVRNKTMKKKYLTIVNGKLENEEGTLENYLFKIEKLNRSKVVKEGKQGAKLAILDYKVLEYDEKNDLSLLKINLHTGRHHQIRVQLSNIGHSIYGDQRYGGRTDDKNKQIALWAYNLQFKHPTKDEFLEFTCLPDKKGVWSKFNIS